jgi:hypothetical protein
MMTKEISKQYLCSAVDLDADNLEYLSSYRKSRQKVFAGN